MRGFFLLLLLTNVAFLGWQYWKHEPADATDVYRGVAVDNQGLTLLSELAPAQRPALREGPADEQVSSTVEEDGDTAQAVEASPPVVTAEESIRLCLRVGEIAQREELDKLVDGLKELGATGLQEGSEQSQKTNYWVMLPPYNSRDRAAEAAAILKQKRMRDFFVVRSGEYENAVSLGVFSTRERAQRRYDEIVALKARLRQPRIESIVLPAKRYAVRFELGSAEQLANAKKLLKKQGLSEAKEIRCK